MMQRVGRRHRTMVARKYLCAAPHPSTWDDHTASLLKSLGGSQKKREHVIQQTLDALQEMHAAKTKTGPGRKSNAEHALAFYLHVLEVNKSTTDEYSEDRSDRRPADKRHRAKDLASAVGEESDSEGEDDEKKSIASKLSMDSKEFLDQHNDQCEVCNLGGQLLCCSTCNLVFHLDCVRPVLKELPKDHWSCAYCIASGSVGYSKDSKTRKKARAAVRAMARLSPRKQKEANNHSDTEEEGENEEETQQSLAGKSEGKESMEGTSSEVGNDGKEFVNVTTSQSVSQDDALHEGSVDNADNAENGAESHARVNEDACDRSKESASDQKTPLKRKLDLHKITDSLSPKLTPESGQETRARRPRRQPTLYNPQTGAARKWQSDVSLHWKSLSDELPKEEQNEEEVINTTEKEEQRNDEDEKSPRKLTDSIWCNFCKDDNNITICCFCACRVCFGKHDASKLLLCDSCDDEYHTFCLDPPLETVPSSRKWFCPSCQPSEKKPPSVAGATRSSLKSPSDNEIKPLSPTPYGTRSNSTPKKSPTDLPVQVIEEPVVTVEKVKRKVGRPRKQESLEMPPDRELPIPKKRGRPPKITPLSDDDEQKPRKRGRPPKSESEKEEETIKPARKRGRPPKSRLPHAANKNTTPTETNRPAKKIKLTEQDSATQGVTPTRSSGKASATSRVASSSGSSQTLSGKGVASSTTTPSQSGKHGFASPVSSHPDTRGDVLMPPLPDGKSADIASPKLNPRLAALPVGVQVPEHSDNLSQLSGQLNSLLASQSGSFSSMRFQRSRSGRTVKRSSFHDEIEEGEQHLRSARYALEMQRKAAVASPEVSTKQTEDEEIVDNLSRVPEYAGMSTKPTAVAALLPISTNFVQESSFPASDDETIEYVENNDIIMSSEAQLPGPMPSAEASTDIKEHETVPEIASLSVREVAPVASQVAALPALQGHSNPQASIGPSEASQSGTATSAAKGPTKMPRRKPGARECMQISRRFGAKVIPQKYMDILMDYCTRGKVEHLIRMRERLDSHSRFLESQLAGLETLVKEKGELDVVVPPMPGSDKEDKLHPAASIDF